MSTPAEELEVQALAQDVEEQVQVQDTAQEEEDAHHGKDTTRSRKERPTGTTHFGDVDFELDELEELGDASWGEVCTYCCTHTPEEWGYIFIGFLCVCFFLYFFLFGLELLGSSAKVIGGCTAGSLFGDDTNPIAGMMVGILATVLLQSSSTTTSIIVSLVGSDTVTVRQGIYMIMGANIGTSVTNTIVALGQMGDGDQLERAFAGATVHDCFNIGSVIILLPLEVISGYLYYLTKAMISGVDTEKGDKWEGPVKKLVSPLGKKVIIANKDVIKDVAGGDVDCADYYPVTCDDGVGISASTCNPGLIGCDKDTDDCPAFFQEGATRKDDEVAGGVCFFIALVILLICLIGLVWCLQKMLLGASTRIIYKATNINGYFAMALGAGITMLVQSSSITTSALTPLVGMGVLRLEQMLPLTLGANIGTTVTAILAALVTDGTNALQVALAHLFFNISGIIIFYPIPFMRNIPLTCARKLGKMTRIWRGFPIVYIAVVFFLVPLLLLGISSLFEQDSKGYTVLGAFLVILAGLGIIYMIYNCRYKGGKERCVTCMKKRQRVRATNETLPDDMDYLKSKVQALVDHTGLPEDEDEDDEMEPLKEADKDTSGDEDSEEVAA